MAYGELGPTHHSTEDFAWVRALPNVPVIAPADRIETAAAVEWAKSHVGPVFLRLSRVGVPDLLPEGTGSNLAGPTCCAMARMSR